jgi:hypothetical protein
MPRTTWANRLLVLSHVALALHATPRPAHDRSIILPRHAHVADTAEAADAGDAAAQCQLARAYRTGDGVAQDAAEAARWYRRAADQGWPEAQFNLGVCYARGVGVAQDLACAAQWLQQAADLGHAGAVAACAEARSEALALRVEREANLMPAPAPLLTPPDDTGFGSGYDTDAYLFEPAAAEDRQRAVARARSPRAYALSLDGVVRINGALSPRTAAALRHDVLERRAAAYAAVASGSRSPDFEFGTFMQYAERCDLLLPLKGNRVVQRALRELLCGAARSGAGQSSPPTVATTTPLCDLLLATVGQDAVLYELAALVSEPGAPRQPVHPDSPWQAATPLEPPLLTSFVALQAVADAMGPTLFLPGTHGSCDGGAAHAAYSASPASLDALLHARPSAAALLGAGDASCFDSRILHCGGANAHPDRGGKTRALFYVSFRNPLAAQPIGTAGSLRKDVEPLTLVALRAKLAALGDSDDDLDPFACEGNSRDL